jgi:hydrogenase expression/formation protein HypE
MTAGGAFSPGSAPTLAGHVALPDDLDGRAGGGLRTFLRDALDEARGPCPPLGEGRPLLLSGTYVADPPFYGDGDIGQLAACCAVNELAAAGARPLGLSVSAVVEAGLPLRQVRRVADSVRDVAQAAGVSVLDVDARVVRAGEADQIYLHTAGLGVLSPGAGQETPPRAGDRLLVSAPLGGFGAHLLSARARLGHEGVVSAACVPLAGLLEQVRGARADGALRAVRVVGRAGLAGTLHAYASATGLGMRVREAALPVHYEVRVALDELGVEPVHAATVSCVCLVVSAEAADDVLAALRAHPYGRDAAVVGEVTPPGRHPVELALVDARTIPVRAAAEPPARLA